MSWYDGDADAPRRFYKLSLLSGLFLAAPLVMGTVWYAWSSFASVERYRRVLDAKGQIDVELFQVALHDELTRDLRALTLDERPLVGRLPTYELSLSRSDLDTLGTQLGGGGAKTYVTGLLKANGDIHEIELRYRGEQPWHSLGVQKSMKVKVTRGELVDGVRVFNLLNDPTPFGLEDQIILDLARESGLLTPDYRPVRVRLNNNDLGVFRLESQPDESLIRQNHRIPGNMYSGDAEKLPGNPTIGPLFSSTVGWTKNANRSEADTADVSELARFIGAVRDASHLEFAAYAQESLDLVRYARFDALDVVFGGDEHDFLSNHRFYADPYRGTLEPVAWVFRGFSRDESFNGVDSPLLIRLKTTPGYLALRDRAVYALLTGPASVPAIHDRAERGVAGLAEELAADPYWDAYKLLPRATRLHRSLNRPMTFDRWILATEYEIDGFAKRSRYLLDVLEEPNVDVVAEPSGERALRVAVTLRGHAAYTLEEVRATAECGGAYHLIADADLDGQLVGPGDVALATRTFGQSARVDTYRDLGTRARLVERSDADPKRGYVRVEQAPTTYTYFVRGEACAPAKVVVVLRSAVTGASARFEVEAPTGAPPSSAPPIDATAPDAVPRVVAGELAPHAWQYPPTAVPRTIMLGPGLVEVPTTRSFGPRESVRIAPGTTLALGPDASLLFHGPVEALGTPDLPITVRRLDAARAFGGIALQGRATAGSRLVDVRIDGGSRAHARAVEYTGLINVHDTHDVSLESWTIGAVAGTDDVIHAYLVQDLVLHEIELERAPIDAIDLEFVSADLRGVRIIGAGDDCLDLMGATLRIQDSLIAACTNNGISAGEETELTATGVVITGAKVGVLSKNASTVRLVRSLVHDTEHGLRTRRKETRYGGPSRIGTSETFVVDAEVVQDAEKGSAIELDQLRLDMPGPGELGHVLGQVLHARAWSEVGALFDALRERGRGP